MQKIFFQVEYFFILLILVTACNGNLGTNENKKGIKRLDSLFTNIDESERWMGSFSMYEDSTEIYSRSFGYANINHNVKNNQDTKFRLGSISSLYTATIIMKLVENGDLRLEESINFILPEVVKSPKIKVEDLLKHESGVFNILLDLDYWSYYRMYISKDELYNKIVKCGLVCEPGSKRQYSSSNYILLALLAEKLTGKEYSELLDSFICKPLNLKNTYIGSSISILDNEASSYLGKTPNWYEAKETDLSTAYGEGFIVSTPSELNKFIFNLFNDRIISVAYTEKMLQYVGGIGMAFQEINDNDNVYDGLVGNVDGFNNETITFVKDNKRYIASLFCNASSNNTDLVVEAVNAFLSDGNGHPIPKFKKFKKLTDAEKDNLIGVYKNEKFNVVFKIFKDEELGNLELIKDDEIESHTIECFDNNEFEIDIEEEESPITFTISADNKILLNNGMELIRK